MDIQVRENHPVKIDIGPVTKHPFGFIDQRVHHDGSDASATHASALAYDSMIRNFPKGEAASAFRDVILGIAAPKERRTAEYEQVRVQAEARALQTNEIAKSFRENARHYQTVAPGRGEPMALPAIDAKKAMAGVREIVKSNEIAKSVMDVGTLTNFSQITGGQSLGYVSLDTRIARGTVRPDSFTLYQALPKSAAYQPVDYFAYIDNPGGPLPGSAFSGFSNVQSGTLATDAGVYQLQNINLKLGLDGRAVTAALMAQNSFVDVVAQENANAALTVLGSMNWASYWGAPSIFPNQPAGLAGTIPASNIFDFQQFMAQNGTINGWSIPQGLYNMIYEVSAVVTSWGRFGRITHAFMTPTVNGSLQGLVTTVLNNLVNLNSRETRELQGIVVDGDLQGMRTRMGVIQFPLDLFITARDMAAQAQVLSNGSNPATSVAPTPPASVTATVVTGAPAVGSNWGVGVGSPFLASGSFGTARYAYAVASTDVNMNESTLTWSAVVAGISVSGAYNVAIAPPGANDAFAFRVFRTGDGGFAGSANSPTAVRYVGTILASGATTVNFVDLNSHIPGSETIFLLDMRSEDFALDYRFLLPLTRIELFAQNLYMPWAVATIGAIRNRIPKFHAEIVNYIPDNPTWTPYGQNA